MTMRVLILGSTGMLGNILYKYLSLQKELIIATIDRKDYSVKCRDLQKLSNLIDEKNPDIIINCIGLIPQKEQKDDNSNNGKNYTLINSEFPDILSVILLRTLRKCKLIHITTDCIYDGEKGNYNENDVCNVDTDYGKSKYVGEMNIEKYDFDYIIIRTSIIGTELGNSKASLLEWLGSNSNKSVDGYTNHYWNGVTTLELSKVIYSVIKNNICIKKMHVYSEKVSKYELLNIINDVYEFNVDIIKNTHIKNIDRTMSSIYTIPFFKIPDLKTQIKRLKEFNEKN